MEHTSKLGLSFKVLPTCKHYVTLCSVVVSGRLYVYGTCSKCPQNVNKPILLYLTKLTALGLCIVGNSVSVRVFDYIQC